MQFEFDHSNDSFCLEPELEEYDLIMDTAKRKLIYLASNYSVISPEQSRFLAELIYKGGAEYKKNVFASAGQVSLLADLLRKDKPNLTPAKADIAQNLSEMMQLAVQIHDDNLDVPGEVPADFIQNNS